MKTRDPRNLMAWLLLAPALAVVAGIVGYPFLRTLYLSFFHAPLIGPIQKFLGIGNYVNALSDPTFRAAIVHTIHFAVFSVGIEVILGIATAMLLNRSFVGRPILRSLLILPLALPTVVNAAMWRWIYNPQYGALNALLTQLHIIPSYRTWLGHTSTAMNMIVLADVWKNYPLVSLLVLAGLQTIPQELFEAAKIDGANAWQRFTSIVLPGIRPALLVALVLRTIEALKVFDIIYVMTRGGPANATKTLSFFVYDQAFSYLNLGKAAADAFITVMIIMIFVAVYVRIIRSEGVAE